MQTLNAVYKIISSRPLNVVHLDLSSIPGVSKVEIDGLTRQATVTLVDRAPSQFPLVVKDQTVGGIMLELLAREKTGRLST